MRIVFSAAALLLFLETMSSTFPSCYARTGWSPPGQSPPPLPPSSPSPTPSHSPPRWDTCFWYKQCKMSICTMECLSKGYKGVGSRCMKEKQNVTMEYCCCKMKGNLRM
ncbi:unnamed protein product [Urochloa decumbens]|uniref:Uncharacterized protein n=1 Tax=Urochloa decumbens TaxID=240449 RepID=A0ABC9B589_9POAL